MKAAMVVATILGRKTKTRRVIKVQPKEDRHGWIWKDKGLDAGYCHTDREAMIRLMIPLCPHGKVGDKIWVRETWAVHKNYDSLNAAKVFIAMGGDVAGCIDYAATPRNESWRGRWRPSIFMPPWACRLELEITSVGVEKLKDITYDEIVAEGAFIPGDSMLSDVEGDFLAKQCWKTLWDSINKKRGYGWNRNPWVWVITFKRLEAR